MIVAYFITAENMPVPASGLIKAPDFRLEVPDLSMIADVKIASFEHEYEALAWLASQWVE